MILPTGSVLWLVLIGLIVVSATRMEKATGFFMYGLRLGFVLSAFVVYLYVYNAARGGIGWQRLLPAADVLLARHGRARLDRRVRAPRSR